MTGVVYDVTGCWGEGAFRADTCASAWDTVLYLRDGECDVAVERVRNNDSFCGGGALTEQSSISAVVDAGSCFLTLDGRDADSCGNYVLDVQL